MNCRIGSDLAPQVTRHRGPLDWRHALAIWVAGGLAGWAVIALALAAVMEG